MICGGELGSMVLRSGHNGALVRAMAYHGPPATLDVLDSLRRSANRNARAPPMAS